MSKYQYAECQCGSNKIENKDLGLCGTCNKARLKAEKPQPVPRERKQLARVAFANTGSTLPQQSAKMKETLKEYRKVKKQIEATRPGICVSCGSTFNLTPSHILTQHQFEKHRNNERNMLVECGECHWTWENDKGMAKQLHASWKLKMQIWEELEPADFMRFKLANPALFR